MNTSVENMNNEETLTSIETYIAVYKYALKKAQSPLLKTFLMGIAAGLWICQEKWTIKVTFY
ncbi:hypothetical protein [Spiroplasma endosymbiont of Colias croceus]|uniref:hypothetical protein n=1 Tax=Spiroplasma endosymbiont of Colias croceus TaxID=3066310 RepID=UPI0030D40E2C